MNRDPLIVRVPTLLMALNPHETVLAAIEAHGGRLVASFVLDEDGRTLGTGRHGHVPGERRERHCSACGGEDHDTKRCNGAGKPPKPTHRERRMGLVDDDRLAEARAELRQRIAERRRHRR